MRTGVLLCLLLAASLSLLSCRRNHPPDTPSRPAGPNSLWPDETGEFYASTHDRDYSDSVSFQFDWAGGDTSAWTPFSESAGARTQHAWVSPGLYEVRVRARDGENAQSGWSEPLAVEVGYAGFAPNVNVDQGLSCCSPSIAIGPRSGNYQPIYVAMEKGTYIAFQKSTDAGASWLADTPIICPGVIPSVTTDRDGNIYVVCIDVNHIDCVHSFDGGATWSPPVRVDDGDSTVLAGIPSIATDTGGRLFCAWDDDRLASYHVWSSVSTDRGTTWSRNVRVDDDTTNDGCSHRDVYVQPGTNQYLEVAVLPGGSACLYRSRDMGQTFEPRVRLETSDDHTAVPHVVADRTHVICAYVDDSRDNGQTKARTLYTQPDTWGPCVPVTDASYSSWYNCLAMSSDGVVHAALTMSYHDGCWNTYYVHSTDNGATWSGHERVNEDTTGSKLNPDIAVDSAGYAYLVWEDGRVWFTTNNPAWVVEGPASGARRTALR